ncbi:MAG: hypothetical protein J6D29_04160 [Solobacterium sp.]|nr:hypothetical protein [Solobacterium sp.]
MKPQTKKAIAYAMILGDLFMLLVGAALMMDGDIGIGLAVLGIVIADIYMTVDYISEQNGKIKILSELEKENFYEEYVRKQASRVQAKKKPKPQEEEEDLQDVLNQNQNQSQNMHG